MTSRPGALTLAVAATALMSAAAFAALHQSSPQTATRSASYAILGRDPLTGELGVAAASYAPLIGMNLEYLDYELGGVIVLGGPFLEINEKTLAGIESGLLPGRAITIGLYGDEDRENRQVMALSPYGAAAFTGDKLEGYAGDKVGDGFVIAGHRLAGSAVVMAMEESFATSGGRLADRLLAHSAALLVVGPGAIFATRDRLVDLRVDYVPGDAVWALAQTQQQIDSIYEVN